MTESYSLVLSLATTLQSEVELLVGTIIYCPVFIAPEPPSLPEYKMFKNSQYKVENTFKWL